MGLIVLLGLPMLFIAGIYVLFIRVITPLIHWFLGGNNQTTEENNIEQGTQDKPLQVQIKDNKLDSSRIVEYQGEAVKQFEFRPQNFSQFISQEDAKAIAKTIMKKAERGIRSHFILSAIKGHGKTTFVELLAKHLGAKLIQRIGKQVDEDSLVDIINEINTSEEKHIVFFIDEIDTMDWKILKVLNPIIEQFKINGKQIKPFIFAGATINKHVLVKNNPDTLDRIPHHIHFHRYKAEDIAKILRQYQAQLYSEEKVADTIINTIALNAKFNPRTSICLLEDYIIEQNMKQVLQNNRIVKDGLNMIDIQILKVLNQSTKAMGANAVALKVGLSPNEYTREFEPFLYEFGYINRVPSRVITDKGKQLLEEIKC